MAMTFYYFGSPLIVHMPVATFSPTLTNYFFPHHPPSNLVGEHQEFIAAIW